VTSWEVAVDVRCGFEHGLTRSAQFLPHTLWTVLGFAQLSLATGTLKAKNEPGSKMA
jgi:hypothetical protein